MAEYKIPIRDARTINDLIVRLNNELTTSQTRHNQFQDTIIREVGNPIDDFIDSLDACDNNAAIKAEATNRLNSIDARRVVDLLQNTNTRLTGNYTGEERTDIIRRIRELFHTKGRRLFTRGPTGVDVGGWKYISKKRTRKFKKTKRRKSKTRR